MEVSEADSEISSQNDAVNDVEDFDKLSWSDFKVGFVSFPGNLTFDKGFLI